MSYSFTTAWNVAHQATLSVVFPRQEYWSGLLFPSPGDLLWPRDQACVSCSRKQILYHWATWEFKSNFSADFWLHFAEFHVFLKFGGTQILPPSLSQKAHWLFSSNSFCLHYSINELSALLGSFKIHSGSRDGWKKGLRADLTSCWRLSPSGTLVLFLFYSYSHQLLLLCDIPQTEVLFL